jgi:hypothetical protein
MNEKNIIVTAYYIVENKRPSVDFNDWIENFFYLKSRKIIFTNKETMDNLFLKKFKHIFNDTLFIIQELEDTYIWKNYKNLMEFSEKKDPEIIKGINHNKYLYTIWNNKSFWLKEATKHINAHGYYWVDIGCIRYKSTNDVKSFVKSLNFVNRTKTNIILSSIYPFVPNDEYYVDSIPSIYYNNNPIIKIQGGFFGGGKKELFEWCDLYIDELNQFEKYKVFAGKDQYIMGSIYLKYKYKFDIFIPTNMDYNEIYYCNDIWFRFLKAFG